MSMARPPEIRVQTEGPFISAALLCEKVLQEQDGVLSFIRVIDRVFKVVGPNVPSLPIELYLAVTLKAGAARGAHQVSVGLEGPSGVRPDVRMEQRVLFEGEDRGVNMVFQLALSLEQEGLYWFLVTLDEEPLTRVPLRIVHQPLPGSNLPLPRP